MDIKELIRPLQNRPDRRGAGKPIDCPQTAPLLMVLGGDLGTHTLRYADSWRVDRGAKPFGARALELAIVTTDHHHAALDEDARRERFTRNPVVIEFEKCDDGKVATYYGRWVGARGETGPWSIPQSFRIAA